MCQHIVKLLESLLTKYINCSITGVSVSTEEDSFVTMDLLSVSELGKLIIAMGVNIPSVFVKAFSGPPRDRLGTYICAPFKYKREQKKGAAS